MSKYYILTPPPNLTGLFHIGHTLNLIIQEFIKDYARCIHGYNIDSIFGFDHASLYAEILAKQSLNLISKENILKKIKSNEIIFKSNILLQMQEMNITNLNDKNELFTFSSHASEIVNLHLSNLIKENLIFFKKKVCFVDICIKTTLSDIEVTSELVKSNLYYVKYYLENSNNDFLLVATTRPETIEADICLVFSFGDNRYEKFYNLNVVNPISGRLIPVLKSKYVSKDFGTGLVKVTPDFSITDEKIIEEININIDNSECIYDFDTLKFNNKSIFNGINVYEACNTAVDFLNKNNKIYKIESHMTNRFLSVRDKNPVIQIAIPQYFLDMKSLVLNSTYQIDKISILGCKGSVDIKQFISNLNPWCISRQNLYGHVIDNKNVLDTWFSSSLYIPIALYTLNLNRDLTNFIIITAYDIMFFWIYRMFYNSQYFLKKQNLKYVIVHGILCDNNGAKISKSKSNAKYVKFNNLEEFEKHKLFMLCHNLFFKKIILDNSKLIYIQRFINKIGNLIIFFNKYNMILEKDIDSIIGCDPIITYFLSKLLNIFYAYKQIIITEILENIENIFMSVTRFIDYVMKDISINLLNILVKNIHNINELIKKNLSALFNLITCFIRFIIPNIYNNISDRLNYKNNYRILEFLKIIRKNYNIYEYEIIKVMDLIMPIISDKKYTNEYIEIIGISGSELIKFDINKYNICFQIINSKIKFGIYFNSNRIKNNEYSKINNIFRYMLNCSSLKCIHI